MGEEEGAAVAVVPRAPSPRAPSIRRLEASHALGGGRRRGRKGSAAAVVSLGAAPPYSTLLLAPRAAVGDGCRGGAMEESCAARRCLHRGRVEGGRGRVGEAES